MVSRIHRGASASSISLTVIALTSLWPSVTATNPTNPQGCFSSSNGLTLQGHWPYQSQGWCQQQCIKLNQPVMGLTNGGDCWCGNLTPPTDAKVPDSQCSLQCLGWPAQTCGGNGAFQIFLTGIKDSVGSAQDDTDSNSNSNSNTNSSPPPAVSDIIPDTTAVISSTIVSQGPPVTKTLGASTVTASGESTTLPPSVVTIPGAVTQVITATPTVAAGSNAGLQQSSPSPSPSGTSTGAKAGIAVGAILGVLALAACIGFAVFYFLKKRRNEYAGGAAGGSPIPGGLNRNNTANSFSTSGGFAGSGTAPSGWAGRNGSINDSRLDPGMVDTRRGSVGSMFDDSEDYSRRVLKVTN